LYLSVNDSLKNGSTGKEVVPLKEKKYFVTTRLQKSKYKSKERLTLCHMLLYLALHSNVVTPNGTHPGDPTEVASFIENPSR
jgi:hypothetical protein